MVGFCTVPLSPTKASKPDIATRSASPLASMRELRAQLDRALLRPGGGADDPLAVEQGAGDDGVEEDAHAGLAQQVVGGLAPHQRVVHPRPGLAVAQRRRQAAARLEQADELVGEAEHHLARPGVGPVARLVEAADRAREAGDGAAAAKAVALDQHHAQALPRRGDGGGDAGRAAAGDQHVGVDLQRGAPVGAGGHVGITVARVNDSIASSSLSLALPALLLVPAAMARAMSACSLAVSGMFAACW